MESEDSGLMRSPGRITKEQYSFLEEQVRSGRFGSVSEALRAAINAYSGSSESARRIFLVGEALVGEGNEVAHIDLLVGDKEGPVGQAFATGLSSLSAGHTPLLAVIRPNLPPKPSTLIVPKVTIKNLEDTGKIFGPAQAAVAKAVADAVEEEIFPKDKVEDWVVIASVFIHPKAEDERKIYQYNYSATKLALSRALESYPPLDRIIYEKDRARHPLMGFRPPRLWRPPYLQISLDLPEIDRVKRIVSQIPGSDQVILEAGTPLIKHYGTSVIGEIRKAGKDYFILADLKTMDVSRVEVDLAFNETADGVIAAGVASKATLDDFIAEAKRMGIYAFIDLMEVEGPMEKLKSLNRPPDGVIIHRAIDVERTGAKPHFELIKEIREVFKEKKILIAVAGGIVPSTALTALKEGADIIVVGRYITQSRDVEMAAREFYPYLGGDIDLFRVHVE
jgi:bifunctional enzyme Fae/Hps